MLYDVIRTPLSNNNHKKKYLIIPIPFSSVRKCSIFFCGCTPMRESICLTKRTQNAGEEVSWVGVGVVSFCTHFRWLVKGFSCILHPAGYCSLCWSSSSVWFFLSSASVAVCHLAPMGHPSPGSSPIRRPQMFYLCVDNYVDGGKVLLKYAWTRGVWESADGVASRCARPHRSGRHVWFQPLIEWCFSKSAK